jgi:hypothetical protein
MNNVIKDIIGSEYLDNTNGMITHDLMSIHKLTTDKATYHHEYLSNDMEVLFVTDPVAKSRITLCVDVGYSNDFIKLNDYRMDIQGIAHLLEHTILLGKTDNRKHGELLEIVSKYQGDSNACTHSTQTHYYIESHTDFFKDYDDNNLFNAFADSFMVDNVNYDSMIIELDAVNNEHNAQMSNRYRQSLSLFNMFGSEKYRFGNGNIESLIEYGYETLYTVLNGFYKRFYVANNMKLIVVNNEIDNRLIDRIRKTFGQIRNDVVKECKYNSMLDYDYYYENFGKESYIVKAKPTNSVNTDMFNMRYTIYKEHTDDYMNMYTATNFLESIINCALSDNNDSLMHKLSALGASNIVFMTETSHNVYENECSTGFVLFCYVSCDISHKLYDSNGCADVSALIYTICEFFVHLKMNLSNIIDDYYEMYVKNTILNCVFKEYYNETFDNELKLIDALQKISGTRIPFDKIRTVPVIANRDNVYEHVNSIIDSMITGNFIVVHMTDNCYDDNMVDMNNTILTDPYYGNKFIVERCIVEPIISKPNVNFNKMKKSDTLISFDELQKRIDALSNNDYIKTSYYSSNGLSNLSICDSMNAVNIDNNCVVQNVKFVELSMLHFHGTYTNKERSSYSRGNVAIMIKLTHQLSDLFINGMLKHLVEYLIGGDIIKLNSTGNHVYIKYNFNASHILIGCNSIHMNDAVVNTLMRIFESMFIERNTTNTDKIALLNIIRSTHNNDNIAYKNALNNIRHGKLDNDIQSLSNNHGSLLRAYNKTLKSANVRLITLNIPFDVSADISSRINTKMYYVRDTPIYITKPITIKNRQDDNGVSIIDVGSGPLCNMIYSMYVCTTRFGYINDDCIADNIPLLMLNRTINSHFMSRIRHDKGMSYSSVVHIGNMHDMDGSGNTEWYMSFMVDGNNDVIDTVKQYVKNELLEYIHSLTDSDIDTIRNNYIKRLTSNPNTVTLLNTKIDTLSIMNNGDNAYHISDVYVLKNIIDCKCTTKELLIDMFERAINNNKHYITIIRS